MSIMRLRSFDSRELFAFIVEEPMLAHFFMRTKVIEEDDFPAPAGVCIKKGQIHLYLNPSMMQKFKPNEKIGVLVHEFLHVLLLHCSGRFATSSSAAKNQGQRMKENVAMDMAINQLIKRTFDLPDCCVEHNKEPFDFPEGLTAEQYFDLIDKQISDEDMENQSNMEFDDHSMWEEGNELEGRAVVKDLAKSYAQTKNGTDSGRTLKQAGNQFGNVLENLLAIETYEISWQTRAKKFIHSLLDDKRRFTYKRFSRRFGFPAPGQKFKTKAKVAAIVDTSGSMSASYLSHIGGQLNLMTKVMQVDVLWCDANLQGVVKKYRPSRNLEVPGRGGTDMQPAFDYASEERYRGVICFTDGYLYTETLSKLPTLWVIVNNSGFTAPFGDVVHVDWRE